MIPEHRHPHNHDDEDNHKNENPTITPIVQINNNGFDDDNDDSSTASSTSSEAPSLNESQSSLEFPMVSHHTQKDIFENNDTTKQDKKQVRFVPSSDNIIHVLPHEMEVDKASTRTRTEENTNEDDNVPHLTAAQEQKLKSKKWYSRDEIVIIRKEQRMNLRAIKTAQQGLCELNTLKYCLRGLEEYQSKQKHQNKRKKVKATIQVVLNRQEHVKRTTTTTTTSNTSNCPEQTTLHTFDLAKDVEMQYKISSRWALQKALLLGAQDAKDAQGIYEEEFGKSAITKYYNDNTRTRTSLPSAETSAIKTTTMPSNDDANTTTISPSIMATTSPAISPTSSSVYRRPEPVFREYKPRLPKSSQENKNDSSPTAANNLTKPRRTVYARRAQTA